MLHLCRVLLLGEIKLKKFWRELKTQAASFWAVFTQEAEVT